MKIIGKKGKERQYPKYAPHISINTGKSVIDEYNVDYSNDTLNIRCICIKDYINRDALISNNNELIFTKGEIYNSYRYFSSFKSYHIQPNIPNFGILSVVFKEDFSEYFVTIDENRDNIINDILS
jgi:hypothetical protein